MPSFSLFINCTILFCIFATGVAGAKDRVSLRPTVGWYAPSFGFYNEQYVGTQEVFPNDVANFYQIPELSGAREIGFEVRLHVGNRWAVGLQISHLRSQIAAELIEPASPSGNDGLTYRHEINLTPLVVGMQYYVPLASATAFYVGQGIGVVVVREKAEAPEIDNSTFTDANRALGLLFQPAVGIEQRFAGDALVFAEIQYLLGGYSAQGWRAPLDPNKSTFLRRGSVSLSGFRLRLGLGFGL